MAGAVGALFNLAQSASTSTVTASVLMIGFLSLALIGNQFSWLAGYRISYSRQCNDLENRTSSLISSFQRLKLDKHHISAPTIQKEIRHTLYDPPFFS